MTPTEQARQSAAREHAFSMRLEDIDPATPDYFEQGTVDHYFERLRRDDPVHYAENPLVGGYWSVTRFKDIMQMETHHRIFSSDWRQGGITLTDEPEDEHKLQMFIAMDTPQHDVQRKAVSPIVSPGNLANMQDLIRERTCRVLDSLPRGETFDWVDKVSIELTTLMLATLFDFPLEDRRLLTHWSNVATSNQAVDPRAPSPEERRAELQNMLAYFTRLWNERVNAPPAHDLVSMLAHNPETRNMGPREYMGNLVLLIVGGNDTTRNSMTGGLLALSENPAEWDKLRANPGLVENMVSEIIRWQTPLAYMRRTALQDVELGGKTIRKGDKLAMWYLSGNRDEDAIANAGRFLIDRPQARQHLSFGFGIHRCVGNRLAELQLRILWEEILKRFPTIEVMGEPVRVRSTFVHGYTALPVRIPA
ncbi:cytochrome P450 [Verticiella sediminum]|uniref:Cytochrome P450 n=1 Tax=Verticiella sediminum TaxID=1247510 RepID=A0A556AVK0_9BURK|nr:cytochrome P450 [Verticiella sediminum]TSH96405.1 cytochrome P450 [Verticiella sediminum]